MNRLIACGLIGLGLLSSACSTASLEPSATMTTLQPAWPLYFRIEAAPEAPGSRTIAGYLYNTYGLPADDVRILVQAVDGSGAVTGQRIAFVPGVVPGYKRTYFRVGDVPPGNAYHLSVWHFQFRDYDSK